MEDYREEKKLNENTILVTRLKDLRPLVIKKINYVGLSYTEKAKIVDKLNSLIALNCQNIIHYHNCFVDKDAGTINLVMDYYGQGDLLTKIKQNAKSQTQFTDDFIWNVVTDIALALYECHSHNPPIANRNLKASHIFLDQNDTALLSGFDLNSSPNLDTERDMYDFGFIIYLMVTLSVEDTRVHISKLERLPDAYKDLIKGLTNSVTKSRFSVREVLEYPEVIIKVLERKLKDETETYQQEKSTMVELEAEIAKREKRLVGADHV